MILENALERMNKSSTGPEICYWLISTQKCLNFHRKDSLLSPLGGSNILPFPQSSEARRITARNFPDPSKSDLPRVINCHSGGSTEGRLREGHVITPGGFPGLSRFPGSSSRQCYLVTLGEVRFESDGLG